MRKWKAKNYLTHYLCFVFSTMVNRRVMPGASIYSIES
jgi:uncharacterized protein (DUF1810 family)